PAYLKRRLRMIVILALADCLLLNFAAAAAMLLLGRGDAVLLAGAVAGAALAALPGLAVLRSLPFRLPWPPLALAATGLGLAVLLARPVGAMTPWTAAAMLAVAACSAPALWLLLRGMRDATDGQQDASPPPHRAPEAAPL
ncbi:MAG: hypothetical protein ACK4VM_18950, partial [Bosea sp. (in: a-proteobacteria)]